MKSFTCEGIVLKRVNVGDADRIITFFTKEHGKLVAIAKGIRKISSKRAAALEVGTRCRIHARSGKMLPLITETTFMGNYQDARTNLTRITQLQQMLEIIDLLTAENEPQPEIYHILHHSLVQLTQEQPQKKMMLENTISILKILGFTHDKVFDELSLKAYIEELAQKNLRSKAFLDPKRTSKLPS